VFGLTALSMANLVPAPAQDSIGTGSAQPRVMTTPENPKETFDPSTDVLSFQDAVRRSELIYLGEYDGYRKSGNITWDHPPEARYRVTKILKGPPLGFHPFVKYEFHDSFNPIMPKGWKFNEKMMPEKDSEWILFVEYAVPKSGMFELYQGSYGRQPATEENLQKLNSLLDKYNMRNTHN